MSLFAPNSSIGFRGLTYQQMRLMELVAGARREQYPYLIAPLETADADACAAKGFLSVSEDGVASLTEAGQQYIIEMNSITR